MGFYDNFVRLCNEVGKAPNVVAKEIGLRSSGTVTGWKNGAAPRQTVLVKLSAYFGVSVDELTGEQTKKPATEVTGKSDRRSYAVQMVMDATDEELEDYLNYMEWKKAKKEGEK